MRILPFSLLFAASTLVACGGPSDSTKLNELSDDESKDLCEELVDDNPERTVTCMGVMITVGLSSEDCAQPEDPGTACEATVGDARDCNSAQAALTEAEICMGMLPAACARLASCGAD